MLGRLLLVVRCQLVTTMQAAVIDCHRALTECIALAAGEGGLRARK